MKIIDSKIIDNDYSEFLVYKDLDENLANIIVKTLSKQTSKEFIHDFSLNKKINRGQALALALALKDYILKNYPNEERIGIGLPSCLPGIILNMAIQMAGKVSVNVNFTMGASAAKACIKRAKIRTIIGSNKVRNKVLEHSPNYPWGDNFIDIAHILKKIGKKGVVKKLIFVKLLPACMLSKLFRIPKRGGDKEASIIFTSGSEGEPKAAVLTHKNILSNVYQINEIGLLGLDDTLHGNLPLFHSFGQTIQVWVAGILGIKVLCIQSPLEVNMNLQASREGKSTIMISTPTFLRAYYKKAKPQDFETMRSVVAGAEKTPDGFHAKWEEKFPNTKYLEGYGLTEASPVVSVNLPESNTRFRGNFCKQDPKTKEGSVGEVFPGMQMAVADINTGEFLPVGQRGILCLKGPNIFNGYLNMPEISAEKLRDGWLYTGDLAQLDYEGFIFIKGRLSRFSKIGGEMVPHTAVEEAIINTLSLQESEKNLIAIGSRVDESKGEALVLLTSIDIDMSSLRKALVEKGIPNLWIPKHVVKIEEIPILGSGKLDLGTIAKLANQA